MLDSFDAISRPQRIAVALDCTYETAIDIAHALEGRATWLKVGMTLYYAHGPSIISKLKELGFKVFLDLKLHDIPHQVQGAAASAIASGADMLTVHASGGVPMMQAAAEGAVEAAKDRQSKPVLLGITVLTSFSQETLAEVGVARSVEDQVLHLASLARTAGLDGVVASPREASDLRTRLGERAYIVTPGVRPAGSDTGDQSRIATPKAAFDAGASHLVIGRPITQAASYTEAWDSLCQDL